MSFGKFHIVGRALLAAIASTIVTLILAVLATSLFGGEVSGTGLLLCILCPLLIGGPASALQFWQQDRLKAAREALIKTRSELEDSNANLQLAFDALQDRARHDGLTGILNREAFLSELKSLGWRMDGTLLFIDADNFKQVNDVYGHPTGDRALRAIAFALAARIRTGDLLGRIGGEEFAIFLVGLQGREAHVVAEAIRSSIRSINLESETGAPVDLSISVGGVISSAGFDIEALWRTADRYLYQAKSAGRDRVIIQTEPRQGLDRPLPATPGLQLAG